MLGVPPGFGRDGRLPDDAPKPPVWPPFFAEAFFAGAYLPDDAFSPAVFFEGAAFFAGCFFAAVFFEGAAFFAGCFFAAVFFEGAAFFAAVVLAAVRPEGAFLTKRPVIALRGCDVPAATDFRRPVLLRVLPATMPLSDVGQSYHPRGEPGARSRFSPGNM
ncbi:hypothetical protein GCM10023350_46380 [Nocardioides endophyticus]|uniref:Uncharacterized protein n=1 Tax=Nocardioides endophyticus TaxID=1353775 RepID=A0ABP8ZG39_9ACTN